MDAAGSGLVVERVEDWAEEFGSLMHRVASCFGRHDLRGRAEGYVRGLLGRVDRKNGWQMAEYLGEEKPYGVQRLLGRARWDANEVRDELTRYAAGHLLAEGEGGVLVVDENGLPEKRGQVRGRAAAVQRHGRTHRKLPDRRVPGVGRLAGAGVGGS